MRKWTWGIGVAGCVCWLAVAGQAGEAKEPAPLPGAAVGAKPGALLPGQPVPTALAPNPADAKINEILKTRQVSFEFVDTPLSDALSFLKATLGLTLVADPKVDMKQRLTLRVTDMNAGAALQWVLRVAGAQMTVRDGAILVTAAPKEEGPGKGLAGGGLVILEENDANRKIAEILKTKKVTFDFVETPFVDTVNFIQALVNVNIVLAPDVKKTQALTLRVNDMSVGQALQWMVKLVGAKMELKDGALFISAERPEANVPRKAEGGRDPRFQRMVGKAQVNLGPTASVEFYLYEDDIPRELREAVLNALQRALVAELRKAGKAEEGAPNK